MDYYRILVVSDNHLLLLNRPEGLQTSITVKSEVGYAWLANEQNRPFSFRDSRGTFTARQERKCARAARMDLQFTPTNACIIVKICVHLDGLPPAFELASARLKLLPLQALLAQLKYRLQGLTAARSDVFDRQQMLCNAIVVYPLPLAVGA